MAKNAAEAFQLAGSGANAVYPEALRQAELGALRRNGVVAPELPIVAMDLTGQ
ncbi:MULTISPECIES: hypothetical protein [Devosia]|uniref:hypothetical protein n=1 Tax=Devosia TaxID=46913 RepID=UPI0027372D94|nr:hypothetical protein [Devosia sp.]MDP2780068.1 hypothetical protein [Devosia sp.]